MSMSYTPPKTALHVERIVAPTQHLDMTFSGLALPVDRFPATFYNRPTPSAPPTIKVPGYRKPKRLHRGLR
jgi:hypothetical protein